MAGQLKAHSAHGVKMEILCKAITHQSLTMRQIADAHPELGEVYINATICQQKAIIKHGKDKTTGRWRYRYKPALDVPAPGRKLNKEYSPTSRPPFGRCLFMTSQKIPCLRRLLISNTVSTPNKEILENILRDYCGAVYKSKAGGGIK